MPRGLKASPWVRSAVRSVGARPSAEHISIIRKTGEGTRVSPLAVVTSTRDGSTREQWQVTAFNRGTQSAKFDAYAICVGWA